MKNSPATQSDGPIQGKVKLTNSQGLHLRPMQAFVELAAKFPCHVKISRKGMEPVDGKSIWNLMSLLAEQGTELIVEAEGPGSAAAVDELIDLLANLETRVNVTEE
jgi:phosphotransferase system HPr (HPr) family protein